MKRILIVDDAIDLGRLFQDALKSAHPDIPVSVVPSGEEALLESTHLSFDLLVTDIRLPGMSGLDLIRKIRLRQPHIRVIVITGISLDERLKKQKDDLNPEVFMRKPIGVSEFLDAVDQLLGFSEEETLPEATATSPVEEPLKPVLNLDFLGTPKMQPDPTKATLLDELASVFPGEPVTPTKKTAPLKKGTGMLTMPVAAPAPAETGLSGILSRLRGTLGAQSAILLDERGRPVAQAGDLPDLTLENQLVPPILASLSSGAKISYLLGMTTTQLVHAYRGANLDLVVAPVGQYSLLIAMNTGRTTLRLALAFEEALNAQSELWTALEGMGLHMQSVAEVGAPETLLAALDAAEQATEAEMPAEILETPLGQDPSLEKFEELFAKKKTGQLRVQDADSFWDTAAKDEKQDVSSSGFLSFDQAQKLGLFPTNE